MRRMLNLNGCSNYNTVNSQVSVDKLPPSLTLPLAAMLLSRPPNLDFKKLEITRKGSPPPPVPVISPSIWSPPLKSERSS